MDEQLVLNPTETVEDRAKGAITFVGTATVILRHAGFTILTDPNFLHKGDHVHLGFGMTSERLTEPAIDFEQLPLVDLVVLSHLHEDHFDRLVAERLAKTTPIVTTPHAARGLAKMGFTNLHALDTWQGLNVSKGGETLRVVAMPGKHAPVPLQWIFPSVMGSLLEFGTGVRLYVTGDTLLHDRLHEIPARYPEIDVGLLHLGGTRVLGVLVTMDAAQGLEVLKIVKPNVAIPIHNDDYTVFESPRSEFERVVREAGLEDRVRYLERGETYVFDAREMREAARRAA